MRLCILMFSLINRFEIEEHEEFNKNLVSVDLSST